MKVIAFTIPVGRDQTVIVKQEQGSQFYPHLHRHEEIQLTWVQKGAGALIIGEQLHDFRAGDIYLFAANLPHLFKNDSKSFGEEKQEIAALSLFFQKDNILWQLPELKQTSHFLNQMQGAYQVKETFVLALQRQLKKMVELPDQLRLSPFIILVHQLIQESALSLISTSTIPQISDQEGLRINTILQYVMQHYHRSIPLEEIAAVIHMVPGSFCRYFKQRTGKTFIRFLNEIRIQEACRRLALERESQIATIAFPCGFKNVSTFNRVFRQIKGQSPSEYLASLRKVL